jgi:hypothetical protein
LDDVLRRYRQGAPLQELAYQLGVSRTRARDIIGKQWRHYKRGKPDNIRFVLDANGQDQFWDGEAPMFWGYAERKPVRWDNER